MRVLWTLLKVAIGLAVAIPVGLFVMSLAMGVVGTVLALVFALVRLACIGLVAYGAYRVARFFLAPRSKTTVREIPASPPVDPYYSAAMRELDAELRQ